MSNYEKIHNAAKLLTQAITELESTTGWTDAQLGNAELCKAYATACEAVEKAQGRVNNLLHRVRSTETATKKA